MGSHNHHHGTDDGVPHRVNSPRFSGPMTRRAPSFKRNNNNNNGSSHSGTINTGLTAHCEIDLPINSPRSEIGSNFVTAEVSLETILERKHSHHVSHRVHGGVVKSLLRKRIESIVVDLGSKERKKLGHWMFLVFCGVCLFLGVFKICATGWFGSAMDRENLNQVSIIHSRQLIIFLLICTSVSCLCLLA